MQIKKLLLEVYPFYLVIAVGKDRAEMLKKLARMGVELTEDEKTELTEDPHDKGFAIKLGTPHVEKGYERSVFLLWVRQKPTTNRWLAIVAHECLHIAHQILAHIGQEHIAFDDDEVEVYLFDYIFEKVLGVVR